MRRKRAKKTLEATQTARIGGGASARPAGTTAQVTEGEVIAVSTRGGEDKSRFRRKRRKGLSGWAERLGRRAMRRL
jgi:hypothetical protein